MAVNHNNFKKRRFPLLSCLLTSRLPRSARDRKYSDAALEALSRLRQSYTQAELAGLLGTSPPVVRSWEKGRRRPSPTACMAILMLEGLVKDWPAKRLPRDDWRQKLWGYPITAILTWRKTEEEEQMIDDYLTQFKASTREAKTEVIRNWEKWIEKLKEILEADMKTVSEVAERQCCANSQQSEAPVG